MVIYMNSKVNDSMTQEAEKPMLLAGGLANTRNITQLTEAIMRTKERHHLLPGISCLYGPSGSGKSTSASYVANNNFAYYVQAASTDSKKSFMQAVLREMRIPGGKTLPEMVEAVSTELAKSGRPLIIDEVDHLVRGNKVELIRDLYEKSQGTILIIGEEFLPKKLEKFERFHGRMAHWVQALPADVNDAIALSAVYAPNVEIHIAVFEKLIAEVRGSTRRVSINLDLMNEAALETGIKSVDLNSLKKLLPSGFVTGESPRPRSF